MSQGEVQGNGKRPAPPAPSFELRTFFEIAPGQNGPASTQRGRCLSCDWCLTLRANRMAAHFTGTKDHGVVPCRAPPQHAVDLSQAHWADVKAKAERVVSNGTSEAGGVKRRALPTTPTVRQAEIRKATNEAYTQWTRGTGQPIDVGKHPLFKNFIKALREDRDWVPENATSVAAAFISPIHAAIAAGQADVGPTETLGSPRAAGAAGGFLELTDTSFETTSRTAQGAEKGLTDMALERNANTDESSTQAEECARVSSARNNEVGRGNLERRAGLKWTRLLEQLAPEYSALAGGAALPWASYAAFWSATTCKVGRDQQAAVEKQYSSLRGLVDDAREKGFADALEVVGEGTITARTAVIVARTIHSGVYLQRG